MKITNQNPQSKKITTYAKKISTATVTCTTDEKALMKAEVTSMESAIASVSTVLTAIQEQIESKTSPHQFIKYPQEISTLIFQL